MNVNIEITTKQLQDLKITIQKLIDFEIDSLREESEDWGLGEMNEIFILSSLIEIKIDRIVTYKNIKVYVDVYMANDVEETEWLLPELSYRLEKWVPKAQLILNKIIPV